MTADVELVWYQGGLLAGLHRSLPVWPVFHTREVGARTGYLTTAETTTAVTTRAIRMPRQTAS